MLMSGYNLNLFEEVIFIILFTLIVLFISSLVCTLFTNKGFNMKANFSRHERHTISMMSFLEFLIWINIIIVFYDFFGGDIDTDVLISVLFFNIAPFYIAYLGCKFMVFNLIGYVDGEVIDDDEEGD